MSIPVGSPQSSASAAGHGRWYDPNLRVGDAERAEVADRLAQHYSDGRLDHAEFSERLDRAMRAKTKAELAGLLADLPGSEPMPVPIPGGSSRYQRRMLKLQLERHQMLLKHERRQHRQAERQQRAHALRWIPMLVALLIVAVVVVHTLTHSIGAWIVIGLIAFLWVRRSTAGNRGR